VTRVKATIADVATLATHDEAVQRELGDQVWSVTQPAFAERLAALARKISSAD
jgi:enoyl-CoA hydratase